MRDWEAYRLEVSEGRSPEAEREAIDDEARRLESAWLGLRTDDGIPRPALGSDQDSVTSGWVRRGLATRDETRVRLTTEGWLLLDQLAVELDQSGTAG